MVVTKSNFDEIVEKSATKPVLLDFWASWCGPCRMLIPVIEELEKEVGESGVVGKINVDEQGELAQRFQVSSIPTLILLKDGKMAGKLVGYQNKQQLKTFMGL